MRKIRLFMVGAMVALFTLLSAQTATAAITVYFNTSEGTAAASSWSSGDVYIYYWSASDGSSSSSLTQMTNEGSGLYSYTFDEAITYVSFTMTPQSSWGGEQTSDYTVTSTSYLCTSNYSSKYTLTTYTPADISAVTMALDGTNVSLALENVDSYSATNIYYTTDGSTPDNSSTPYTSAIDLTTLTGDVTISAIGYGDGAAITEILTSCTLKSTPITITVDASAPAWSNTYIYYWSLIGCTLSGTTGAEWSSSPEMTAEADGTFSYTFAADVTSVTFLVKNATGDGSQSTNEPTITDATYYVLESTLALTETDPSVITYSVSMALVDGKVELSVANADAAEIYYTTDGTEPSNASTQYTGAITLPAEDCTLQAIAYIDGTATDIVSSTFKAEPITIYVKPCSDWGDITPYIYYYVNEGGLVSGTSNSWDPADIMTDEGNGYYSYTFAADVTAVTAIIKDREGDTEGNTIYQSVDIYLTETGYYEIINDLDDSWKRQIGGITVYFYKEPDAWSTGDDAYIFAWDDENTYTGTWDEGGSQMTKRGDSYWYYKTFANTVESLNVIFKSSDGNEQTIDIMGITETSAYALENSITQSGDDNGYVYTAHKVDDYAPNSYFTKLPSGTFEIGKKITITNLIEDGNGIASYSMTKDGESYAFTATEGDTSNIIEIELDEEGTYVLSVTGIGGNTATSTYTITTPITVYFYHDVDTYWTGSTSGIRIYSEYTDGDVTYLYSTATASKALSDNDLMTSLGDNWYSYSFDANVTDVDIYFQNYGATNTSNTVEGITESKYYEFTAANTVAEITEFDVASETGLEALVDGTDVNNKVNIDITITDEIADATLSGGAYFDADQTLTIADGGSLTITETEDGGEVYSLPTVVIEGSAEINADGLKDLTVAQLEIIKTFTYTGDNASAEWFNLGLPFEVDAAAGNVFKLDGDTYVAAEQGVDYATFDYNGATRAESGTGDNWIMYTDNSGNLGELIQFATTGTHTYKFVATSNAAAAALTDGRDGDRYFDTSKGDTDDNGWNLVPAGKTYTTDYSIDGVTVVQEFVNGAFPAGTLSGLTPGTVVAAKLTQEVAAANLNSDDAQATVETYAFELTNADGKLLDRIYLFDGSDKSQYRVAEMSSLSSTAAQMTITIDGSSYCAYSTLASDINKTYTVALSNVTDGSQLTMTTAGTQSVTVDGVYITDGTTIDVEDGEITITIGSQTSSVASLVPSDINVYTSNGAIIIAGAEAGASYIVTSISGVTIASGVTDGGSTAINLTSGVYILNVSGKYFKVIVK